MLQVILAVLLTQSIFLADGRCDGVVAADKLERAVSLGSCSTIDGPYRVALTVVNDNEASAGTLRAFHLGFCRSSVARGVAPPGWIVTLDVEGRGVRFSRGGEAFNDPGIRSGQRVGGFGIELRSAWRCARQAGIQWEGSSAGTVTTHAR